MRPVLARLLDAPAERREGEAVSAVAGAAASEEVA